MSQSAAGDVPGKLSPSFASLLSATDPLSAVAPLWSSFSSSSPPPAIHTSFINTLLLSDRSCLILCLLNFAIWLAGLLILILLKPYIPGGYYPDTYHSGFWHGFHVWCCLAATLLLFVLFSTPSSKKQRISAIALCILLVCVFTYLVFAVQILPVYTDLFGNEMYPLRYVEWACTTPLMLLLVCNLDVQPRGMVLWIVAGDVAMIATGLLAAISPNYSVMMIWLIVSFMCELDTLIHMHGLFVQYRQLVGSYPRILSTINFLELWLYAAYAWFPAIWCLSAAKLINDDSTSNLYFIGDTMGKLLYTAALLIINFEIVDHQEQLHRVQYEAEMRIQMINEKMRSQEESRRQALVSNERKREFLRYILHEIRVPLNALVLGLEGLKTSVDSGVTGGAQQVRDSTAASNASTAIQYRTPVFSSRVKEEREDEAGQDDESSGGVMYMAPNGDRPTQPISPQCSPLPSPLLERSPVLFSNSSILPLTTSLSRATSLALSTTSSASAAANSLSSFSSTLPTPITLCDEDADSINEMWHAVSHMTRLLDDVLSLQRIEDGELSLERRPFSLPDTCVGAVRMMTTWLDNKGLTVVCDVDSTLPIVVSDEYRVRQVLINFLSNAIRFTPGKGDNGSEGRIVLTVKRCETFDDFEPIVQEGQSNELRSIDDHTHTVDEQQQTQRGQADHNASGSHSLSPSLSSPANSSSVSSSALSANTSSPPRLFIRVSVHDTGIGIPLSDLQRMFTPFVQISSGEAEKGKGTGLGLSICRKLIDLLGGRVGVISAPGKGSTFFFEAPFEISTDQSPEAVRVGDEVNPADKLNSDEATSRTINKPATAVSEPKHDSPQLITSSLRNKRRAMRTKQNSSGDINNIPSHPINAASLSLAASSQQAFTAPLSPVKMVARALTVPSAKTVNAVQSLRRTTITTPSSSATGNGALNEGTSVSAATVAVATSSPNVAAAAPAATASSRPPPRPSIKRPLRILVVDDADSNRKLLARLVSKDGAAVCEQARDGQEAVNMVQNDVARFDVILCDKEMPVMDGYGAVREMRRLGVACPIIGVTANALVNDQAEFIACGLDALVTKPVNLKLLTTAIHESLQQRGGVKPVAEKLKERVDDANVKAE